MPAPRTTLEDVVHTPASWEALADEVTEAVSAKVEPTIRKIADDLYGQILETAQDYLADNIRFNVASRLDTADREVRAMRKRTASFDDLLYALRRLAHLTPESANAANALDLHLSVRAIAETALARAAQDASHAG